MTGDATGARRRWGPALAAAALLLAACVRLTAGLPDVLDLSMPDEANALANGVAIVHGELPPPASSPLYALVYGLQSLVADDRVALYFLHQRLMLIVAPLALFLLFLRLGRSVPTAFALALAFLISAPVVTITGRVHLLALMLVVAAVLAGLAARGRWWRFHLTAVLAMAAAYARPELAATAVLFSGGAVLGSLRGDGRLARRQLVAHALLLAVWVAFAAWCPLGDDSNRTWLAFGQHYARNRLATRPEPGLSPWTDWPLVLSRDFGEADSFAAALAANPAAVARHLLTNCVHYGTELARTTVLLLTPLRVPGIGPARLAALLVLLAGLYALTLRGRRPAFGSEARDTLLFTGAFLLPMLAGSIIIYPNRAYLLTQVPLIVGLGLALLAPRAQDPPDRHLQKAAWGAMLLLALLTPPAEAYFSGPRPRLAVVRALERLALPPGAVVVDDLGGAASFLDDARQLPQYAKIEPLADFLVTHAVEALVVTPTLPADSRFAADPQVAAFLNDPRPFGFESAAFPMPDIAIYTRIRPAD